MCAGIATHQCPLRRTAAALHPPVVPQSHFGTTLAISWETDVIPVSLIFRRAITCCLPSTSAANERILSTGKLLPSKVPGLTKNTEGAFAVFRIVLAVSRTERYASSKVISRGLTGRAHLRGPIRSRCHNDGRNT